MAAAVQATEQNLQIELCPHDLPAGIVWPRAEVAVDLEMDQGLDLQKNRTCLVQVGDGAGRVWLVKFDGQRWECPNLKALLTDVKITKIIHSGRMDMAFVKKDLGVLMAPVFDTKVAARLTQQEVDRSHMRQLIQHQLGIVLPKLKELSVSDWAAPTLSPEQIQYAADDVVHLHALYDGLMADLRAQGRLEHAQKCFAMMEALADLDRWGYNETLLSYAPTYQLPGHVAKGGDLVAGRDVLLQEAAALTKLATKLDKHFVTAVGLLAATTGRVIVTGMGKSGHVGAKIAATFASTGTPAFYVHPGEASHGDLGMITQTDVVLAISHSGETRELGDILGHCKRFGIPLVALTGKPKSTLAQAATVVLETRVEKEACPLQVAPMTSTTATLALGDALAAALMRRKGFQKNDFAVFHPGGKLGNRLQKVADLMAKDNQLPVVTTTTLMREVVVTMTAGRLGTVGVVGAGGELMGVITDGDLRRHLSADMLEKTAAEVMSTDPVTIGPEMLAAEAVHTMQHNRKGVNITAIFVVDQAQRPVGVLHIHACLRAGVI